MFSDRLRDVDSVGVKWLLTQGCATAPPCDPLIGVCVCTSQYSSHCQIVIYYAYANLANTIYVESQQTVIQIVTRDNTICVDVLCSCFVFVLFLFTLQLSRCFIPIILMCSCRILIKITYLLTYRSLNSSVLQYRLIMSDNLVYV